MPALSAKAKHYYRERVRSVRIPKAPVNTMDEAFHI